MPIGEFCNREVVFAKRETSIPEAAQLMRQYHVGDLVVVDEVNLTVSGKKKNGQNILPVSS